MRRQVAGFTLIEVLVSIAIGALLLASLGQLLVTVREGWERSNEIDVRLEGRQMLLAVLSRAIASALPSAALQPHEAFQGTPTGFDFVSLPPQAASGLGPVRVRLSVEPESGGTQRLALSIGARTPAQPSRVSGPLNERRVLARGLRRVVITYTARGTNQALVQWGDPLSLPALVEIVAAYEDDRRAPLSFAARPRVDVHGGCTIDWTSLACRAS